MSDRHQHDDSVIVRDFAYISVAPPPRSHTDFLFQSRRHGTRSRRGAASPDIDGGLSNTLHATTNSPFLRPSLANSPFGAVTGRSPDLWSASGLPIATIAIKEAPLEGLEGAAEVNQLRTDMHLRLSLSAPAEYAESGANRAIPLTPNEGGNGAEGMVGRPMMVAMHDPKAPGVVCEKQSAVPTATHHTTATVPHETEKPRIKDAEPESKVSDAQVPVYEPEPGDRNKFEEFLKYLRIYYCRPHQSQHQRTAAVKAAVYQHLSLVPRGGYHDMGFTKEEEWWLWVAQAEEARIAAWAKEKRVKEARARESWDRIWDHRRQQERLEQEREERKRTDLEKMRSGRY